MHSKLKRDLILIKYYNIDNSIKSIIILLKNMESNNINMYGYMR